MSFASGPLAAEEEDRRGRVLVALARASIEAVFGGPPAPVHGEPWLCEPGASFVTLKHGGALRGCIGSIQAYRSLGEDVANNARSAALRDPRFPKLAIEELPVVRVEVTILSPREVLPDADDLDAAAALLRPGVDGVVLECGARRSVFIPQVWEDLRDPRAFLTHLRRKAGLPAEGWTKGTRLSRFTARHFGEP